MDWDMNKLTTINQSIPNRYLFIKVTSHAGLFWGVSFWNNLTFQFKKTHFLYWMQELCLCCFNRIILLSSQIKYWLSREQTHQSTNISSASIHQRNNQRATQAFSAEFPFETIWRGGHRVKKSACKHSSFLVNIYFSTRILWLPKFQTDSKG